MVEKLQGEKEHWEGRHCTCVKEVAAGRLWEFGWGAERTVELEGQGVRASVGRNLRLWRKGE